ncbi:MAG: elongation factor P maturation arginine rhamnosyltransferase EarP, partial [Treponema sp.]|nr:elongation factor P maturation arginine rhamnosyltransferase EarP [Treponema sp.]
VVYRLVKQIKRISPQTNINLLVDNLESFNKLCDKVKVNCDYQLVENINVYHSTSYDYCYNEFSKNDGQKLSIILECFQCGRPDWMEKILFEDKLNRTCHVIMIDYLTAEDYAEDFHCLQSLTRSAKVQKVNFMPGFTSKTGGLIIDQEWEEIPSYNPQGNILIFTYERKWNALVKALNKYGKNSLLAQGRGFDSLMQAVKEENQNLDNYKTLPFVNQTEWDKIMKESSILFIRGEESMSRACLSGIPFVWHAYPQSDEYQLVKVQALLKKLEKYFSREDYEIIERLWLDFNKPENEVSDREFEEAIFNFLINSERLRAGFFTFAEDLRKVGDLAHNLMTFIQKNVIIK